MARIPRSSQRALGKTGRPGRHSHNVRSSGTEVPLLLFLYPPFTHASFAFPTPVHQGIPAWAPVQEDYPQGLRAFAPPFLSPLCGPQERWSELPYRPLIPEHPPGGSYLQNGAYFGDCLWNCPPHVGLHGGPQICLLPCNHGMGIPRVPCICGGRADLCLPGYAVRPFSGPLGFLQEHQTYQIPSPYFTVPFHTYLDDFSLPHPGSLWLFRLHTSFLFSNNLVSGYTSPSHNLLCPRWSST